jgi:cation transporter-like permease
LNWWHMRMLGTGSTILLLVLLAILAAVAFFVYQGTLASDDRALPTHFYIAMTLGVVFSLLVGIGLMALVFYSSRRGHDEPPNFS